MWEGGDWEWTAQSYLEEQGGEREGAYLDILFKGVICAKQGEENMCAQAGVVSPTSCTFVGRKRKESHGIHSVGP